MTIYDAPPPKISLPKNHNYWTQESLLIYDIHLYVSLDLATLLCALNQTRMCAMKIFRQGSVPEPKKPMLK